VRPRSVRGRLLRLPALVWLGLLGVPGHGPSTATRSGAARRRSRDLGALPAQLQVAGWPPGSHALESWGGWEARTGLGRSLRSSRRPGRVRVCPKSTPAADHGCAWRRIAAELSGAAGDVQRSHGWSTPDATVCEITRVASAAAEYSAPGSKPPSLSPPGRRCRPRRRRAVPRPGAGRGWGRAMSWSLERSGLAALPRTAQSRAWRTSR
jgi:hypothetical protein